MTVIQVQNNQRMNVTPIVWGTTPDLHSNPERGSGGGECSGGIMAMRAQRRTVIDPM
jgi:hypothetical protein